MQGRREREGRSNTPTNLDRSAPTTTSFKLTMLGCWSSFSV
jgi:hypothetical protein